LSIDEAAREVEVAFLKAEIYRGEIELLVRRVDAYDRFGSMLICPPPRASVVDI
jgi:hypothetical protein